MNSMQLFLSKDFSIPFAGDGMAFLKWVWRRRFRAAKSQAKQKKLSVVSVR